MSKRLERRVINTEFRTVKEEGKPTKLRGYAAVFGRDSEDLGGFVEQIAPGAFTSALNNNPDVRALVNHDPTLILGRTRSGTLTLSQDSIGLYYEVEVPDTTAGRDILVSAERGDITQSSFGFTVDEDDENAEEWFDRNGNSVARWSSGGVKRIVRNVRELFDVSPVTYPAYTDSSVEARSRFCFPDGTPRAHRSNSGGNDEAARLEALRDLARRRIEHLRQRT